jgi:hypothetical protein
MDQFPVFSRKTPHIINKVEICYIDSALGLCSGLWNQQIHVTGTLHSPYMPVHCVSISRILETVDSISCNCEVAENQLMWYTFNIKFVLMFFSAWMGVRWMKAEWCGFTLELTGAAVRFLWVKQSKYFIIHINSTYKVWLIFQLL